jgi:hypothetical protein
MKNFGPKVTVPARRERSLPEKQIFWGSEDGGAEMFPQTEKQIYSRKYATNPEPLLYLAWLSPVR